MKTYFIKKRVRASSVIEAVKLDRSTPAEEVWLADQQPPTDLPPAIGFHSLSNREEDDDLV